jgi:hypothetical protein
MHRPALETLKAANLRVAKAWDIISVLQHALGFAKAGGGAAAPWGKKRGSGFILFRIFVNIT